MAGTGGRVGVLDRKADSSGQECKFCCPQCKLLYSQGLRIARTAADRLDRTFLYFPEREYR
jgi:hypothetical protein